MILLGRLDYLGLSPYVKVSWPEILIPSVIFIPPYAMSPAMVSGSRNEDVEIFGGHSPAHNRRDFPEWWRFSEWL